MLAANVHLSPWITAPVAVAIALIVAWYWKRIGRDDVPPSRRKIRRFSLVVIVVSLPMTVRAMSFVDPALDKRGYAVAWSFVMFMIMLLVASALLDAINTLRIHQQHKHEELTRAATDLAIAIHQRRKQSHQSPNTDPAATLPQRQTTAGPMNQSEMGA